MSTPSLDAAQNKLEDILRKAEKKGISRAELARLRGARKLTSRMIHKSDKVSTRHWPWTTLFGLVALVVYFTQIHTLEGFSTIWLKWSRGNIKEQPCTVRMPDELVKVFRPPVACSICDGVNGVEKVSNLSPDVFEERYAYSGTPVVVTDGMTNWTAQHVFTFNFFKKVYSKRMEQWSLHNCQFFPYNTEFKHLSEVFNMSDERAYMLDGTDPWYVGWSNCDDDINQILRRHYERPYFLPTTAETKKLDWIFMGRSGFGAPMHVDNVEHPSWQAQLRGRKKWILQPPPECFYSCKSVEVVVEPGEIKDMSITIGAEYD